MTPGDISRVQTTSDHPLVGNVYLLRGFLGLSLSCLSLASISVSIS